ncbi:DUF2235 domain-containing protein [Isosphaeraceae bacterium EP7]
MKRIVICYDGTWNKQTSTDPTNVLRFHDSVHPSTEGGNGPDQLRLYVPGVGTEWYDKWLGGLLGYGLGANIVKGYQFLVENYEDGDEIYILGFSRGAYTARSLVGLIRNCHLPHQRHGWIISNIAYYIYRVRWGGADTFMARRFRKRYSREVPIKFLGVWDTVGALGIPLTCFNFLNYWFFRFHDTKLSSIVESAYQAVALDEHRKQFAASLWSLKDGEEPDHRQSIEQRWFVGGHSDVGGGNETPEFSDLTLRWMQDKAAARGLELTPVEVKPADFEAKFPDSYARFPNVPVLGPIYRRFSSRHSRPVSTSKLDVECLDPSIEGRRLANRSYTPTNKVLPDLVEQQLEASTL